MLSRHDPTPRATPRPRSHSCRYTRGCARTLTCRNRRSSSSCNIIDEARLCAAVLPVWLPIACLPAVVLPRTADPATPTGPISPGTPMPCSPPAVSARRPPPRKKRRMAGAAALGSRASLGPTPTCVSCIALAGLTRRFRKTARSRTRWDGAGRSWPGRTVAVQQRMAQSRSATDIKGGRLGKKAAGLEPRR